VAGKGALRGWQLVDVEDRIKYVPAFDPRNLPPSAAAFDYLDAGITENATPRGIMILFRTSERSLCSRNSSIR
jgi:hypothetical protein